MIISQYFTFFIVFSFLGWGWETLFVTAKEKHFSNRGFLFGPICPIYGASVVVGMFLFTQIDGLEAGSLAAWQVFLICAVGSAFAEYGTSYYLEKRFHARWWDYSKMPLNLNGRICVPASVGFGLAGVVLVRWVLPVLESVQVSVHPLIYEAIALALMGAFGADFALTEASLSTLLQKIEATDKEFSERAEAAYQAISSTPQQLEIKINGFEDELHERTQALAEEMSWNQRNKFGSVRSFMTAKPGHHEFRVGEKLREALEERKK